MIEKLFDFLKEDAVFGDITSDIIVPEHCRVTAAVLAEEEGIVVGNKFVVPFLRSLGLEIIKFVDDGSLIRAGEEVLELHGNARKILAIERTILNFMMVLSGIATYTRRMVEKVRGVNEKVIIAATRKTHPGLTFFEKYAVAVGGGATHRFSLSDMVLIKDNHLAIVGDVASAVRAARQKLGVFKKVEVEVRNSKEALEAAEAGADIIMLDNMRVDEVRETLRLLRDKGLRERVIIEVSGGIDENNILEYARLDVDVISLSKITMGANPLKMKLEVVEVDRCGQT